MHPIMQEWMEDEKQFIRDAEKSLVVGICEICYEPFIMQFGHDDKCKECHEMCMVF